MSTKNENAFGIMDMVSAWGEPWVDCGLFINGKGSCSALIVNEDARFFVY